MEKNTILAIILSSLVIIIGFSIQGYFYPPAAVNADQTAADSLPEETVSASVTEMVPFTESGTETPENGIAEEEFFTVETDLVKVTFTNRGGDIVSYLLKETAMNGGENPSEQFIEMADFTSESNRAFSLIFGDADGSPVDRIFNVRRISDTSIGFFAEFQGKDSNGSNTTFVLAKQYTFQPDDYMFELAVSVDGASGFSGLNFNGAAYTLTTSPQIGPEWDSQRDKYDYRRFQYMMDGKQRKVTLSDGQTRDVEGNFSWAGVVSKYFTLLAVPEFPIQKARYSTVTGENAENAAKVYLTRPALNVTDNTDIWHVYIGPRTERELAAYNNAERNPYGISGKNLNQAVESSGILAPLEVILKWIMEMFHRVIPNWGVSIILMTILMRVVIFPLTRKSSESTLKMQDLQPKMKEIQEKYAGNQQRMNEEMAKLYKETGYNPLSGCLPLLIQFPLIFAMYNLFNNYFEFRGAMFIPGWISDLSKGDSVYTFPFSIPFGIGNQLRLLPIIYVISQLIFSKITQPGGNAGAQAGSMKFLMYGMPLIFFFIFYNAPSGLLIYWIFSNLLTLVQQIIINKMIHNKKNPQTENRVAFPVTRKTGKGAVSGNSGKKKNR